MGETNVTFDITMHIKTFRLGVSRGIKASFKIDICFCADK
jgi:hypothetical protein